MTTENDTPDTTDAGPEAALAAAMDAMEAGTLAAPEVQPENLETPAAELPAAAAPKEEVTPEAKPQGKPEDTPTDKGPDGGAKEDDKADKPADQPAQPDPADVAPSSWKRDVAGKWADLPAEVKAEINRRETEYHKGIEQYKPYAQLGQEYERVVGPNLDMIRQAGVQPAQALEYLFNAHRTLTYGTPEQKREAIARIARDCQIDLKDIQPAAPVDPQVQRMMQQNQQLQQFQRETLQQQNQAVLNQIQEFAQAPGHEHFEAVKQDMSAMLQSGIAQDLQEAYDKAVWARADLRKSLVEQQRTEAEKQATEQARKARAKSAAGSVKGSAPSSSGALPANASVEDTVAAAMDGLI